MLTAKISEDLRVSLKSGDGRRASVLRMLLASLKNKEIELRGVREVTDDDVTAVIRKMIKTHEESIVAFEKGQRPDLVAKEKGELQILQDYVPQALSEEAVKAVITEVLSGHHVEFGAAMKAVLAKVKGQADGSLVARLVKDFIAADQS